MRPSNNLESKIPSNKYWRVHLEHMKAQVYSSIEPPLEYSKAQIPLIDQSLLWPISPTWELQNYYAVSD